MVKRFLQPWSGNPARLKSDLFLLLAAAVWGSGFVAQRLAARSLDHLYFNGARFLLGALLLWGINRFQWKLTWREMPRVALVGVLLATASGLQQAGIKTTSISNAAFITGLYVILVPILISIFWRTRITALVWGAALLATLGTALLSMQGSLHLAFGDLLELIGALIWALHLIALSRFATKIEPLQLAMGQFLVCGLVSLTLGLLVNPSGLDALRGTWLSVVYSGIIPVGIGFTLQVVGLKHAPPVDGAVILSMEAVFGALFGYWFMREGLNAQQIVGCVLIMAGILLAQIRQE